MPRSLHPWGCLVAACIILGLTSPVRGQLPHKLVLLIHGGPESYPSNHEFDGEIKADLFARNTMEVEAYSEYLENEEFGEDAYSSLHEYIRTKFRGRRPDIIIANTAPVLDFVLSARDDLFQGVPVVFVANTIPDAVRQRKVPGTVGILREPSYTETAELILKLHPGTRRLHVISYAPALAGFDERARTMMASFSRRLEITWGRESTLPDMLAALKKLPPDTVVLANRYSPTGEGRIIFPSESIPAISAASTVPVYATLDTYIGQGVVGGMMRNSSSTAHDLAALAIRVLEGEAPESIPLRPAVVKPIFDWRQLQRWKIDESRLPAGSEVRLRTLSVWQMYGSYIAATVVVVIAQLLLIGLLLTQRVRLQRADNTIRAREASLRQSFARTRRLAGRLLHAQEEIRAEIARDLHDDVCQKLAYVSVGVNTLRTTSGDIQSPQAQEVFDELERDTRKTFDEIRRMSHDLHPATLRLLGLAPALRAHCADVTKRQGVEVEFACGDIGTVDPAVAVAFYRIAQESLRNSVAHGGATHMTVTVTREDDELELVVADDGSGFDVSTVRSVGGGLGLIAMDERANAMGGEVHITSAPGRGTSIRVRGPVVPPPARVA